MVDVSHFHYPLQAPWRVGKSIKKEKQRRSLEQFFSTNGARFIDVQDLQPRRQSTLCDEDLKKLKISVDSTLNYFLRTTFRGGKSVYVKTWESKFMTQAISLYERIESLLVELPNIEVAYVVNGRFYGQQAAALPLNRLGIKIIYLEHSEFPGRLFMRPYRPHDRVRFQRDALEQAKNLAAEQLRLYSAEWMELRKGPHSLTNPFGVLWKDGTVQKFVAKDKPIALFLTSSSDEFESLELDWKEASWASQYEAFEKIWTELSPKGFKPVIRVHPNLANKSIADAFREVKEVRSFLNRNPDFDCVDHASTVSTYDLLNMAEVVIVYNSTVGLEASLIGKRVICANSTWYDSCADVLKVHKIFQLKEIPNFLVRIPSQVGAQQWIAAQMMSDFELPIQDESNILRMSKPHQIIRALMDRSIFGIMFSARWKLSRFILLKIRVNRFQLKSARTS